jgi:hypothetical protein
MADQVGWCCWCSMMMMMMMMIGAVPWVGDRWYLFIGGPYIYRGETNAPALFSPC